MDLASPKRPWNWSIPQDAAFAKLHKLLCNPPVLKLPDFEKPFVIATDACKYATGAVLLQKYDDGLHPIAYHSSKYTPVECNYGGGKKELWQYTKHVSSGNVMLMVYRLPYILTTNHGSIYLRNLTLVDVRHVGS